MTNKESQPKISIIIPVYNAAELIGPCLSSLCSQSLQELEIICVDDGSSDNSLAVLREYAVGDERIKVITQANKGCGGARNSGLDVAQGEFIQLIDADDKVPDDYCQKMYDAAMRYEADIVVVGMIKKYKNYSKNRFVVRQEAVYSEPQAKFEAIDCPRIFYVMNKLFRRSVLQTLGLRFEENVCYEDVMFIARALCQMGRLVTVPDVNYIYINQSNGITKGKQTPKKQNDRYVAHLMFSKFCDQNNIYIKPKYHNVTVRYWSVLGATLLKITECRGERTWRLFDFIPLYRKRVK